MTQAERRPAALLQGGKGMPTTLPRLTREPANLRLVWDHQLAPLARVAIGDTIEVETAHNMALFHPVVTEDDRFESFPLAMGNPLTGPIAVTGAVPGDT